MRDLVLPQTVLATVSELRTRRSVHVAPVLHILVPDYILAGTRTVSVFQQYFIPEKRSAMQQASSRNPFRTALRSLHLRPNLEPLCKHHDVP